MLVHLECYKIEVNHGPEVVHLQGNVTVCRGCVCVGVGGRNGMIVSECVLVCVQGKGCGGMNMGKSLYGILCVRIG